MAAALVWWDWSSITSHANGLPAAYKQAKVGGKANPLYSVPVPPVARVSGEPKRTTRAPDVPAMPYSKPLEDAFMPSPALIADAMRKLAAY